MKGLYSNFPCKKELCNSDKLKLKSQIKNKIFVTTIGSGLKSTTQNIPKKVLLDTEVKAETDMRYKDKLAKRD